MAKARLCLFSLFDDCARLPTPSRAGPIFGDIPDMGEKLGLIIREHVTKFWQLYT